MTKRPDVFIEGAAMEISWGDARRNLMDLIFDTVRAAVDDAGGSFDGIDSVVLAAHDLVDGRSLSSMVTAPAAGAYLRDEIRYSDDSAGALAAGITRIESGESERTIVATWGRASEHDFDQFSRTLFDPVRSGGLGLHELHISAMNAQKWRQNGGCDADVARAQTRRAEAARANPRALAQGGKRSAASWPLQETQLPLWADMVSAVVISGKPNGPRLRGLGQSSEPYWPGDRELASATSMRQAAERALSEAGVSVGEIDLFELDGMTLYDEALAFEAAGFAPRGGGMAALADDPRCNPSGGSLAGYCPPAMGLTRVVEAVHQLRGTAGAIQLDKPRLAMASGASLMAAQTHTVVLLEAV